MSERFHAHAKGGGRLLRLDIAPATCAARGRPTPAIFFAVAGNVDFMRLDELLSQEERLIRDSVRAFVEERVTPIIEGHFQRGTFPLHLVASMAELGYLGASLSGYNCAGIGPVGYGLIMQELERGDSGLRSFVSVQNALVMYPIHRFGREDQRAYWLPRLQAGRAIGCFGLTEPDFGSNPAGMRTRARTHREGFVLNGNKAWVTNGSLADVAVVWARLEGEGIRGFLVDRSTEGFSTRDYRHKHSLRASVTSELILDNCWIPQDRLLPGTTGLKSALMCLNKARYGIAWGALGAAMACYETARRWALERRQFGDRPIAGHQLVQQKLVYMLTEITKGQLLTYRLGQLMEQGKCRHDQISMAKRNNVAVALRIARLARDLLGANGILADYPVFRHMSNLETVSTYEGTHDIHTLILGQSITGIPAFE